MAAECGDIEMLDLLVSFDAEVSSFPLRPNLIVFFSSMFPIFLVTLLSFMQPLIHLLLIV